MSGLQPYRDNSDKVIRTLQDDVAVLNADNERLRNALDRRIKRQADVTRGRLMLHTSASGLLYMVIAAIADAEARTDFTLNHPYAALALVFLNVLAWTLTSMAMRPSER